MCYKHPSIGTVPSYSGPTAKCVNNINGTVSRDFSLFFCFEKQITPGYRTFFFHMGADSF